MRKGCDMVLSFDLPNQVNELINRLNAHSYKAYIVGKCVQEMIVDGLSVDYDIITTASTEQICKVFQSYNVNTDGIKSGEVLVTVLGMVVMISPYRRAFTEGGYAVYTDDILEDLERRDFSISAIAWHPKEGFIDPFGGVNCLESGQKIVAAIGEEELTTETREIYTLSGKKPPVSPFVRSPVSILKALGYYSSGEYVIAPATGEAILRHRKNLLLVEPVEMRTELSWVIRGKKVTAVMEEYREVFTTLIPEFIPLTGFNQHSEDHAYDALSHTFRSVGYASPILTLRYAMLFHILGKPDCLSVDMYGMGHFYGHAERSRIYAERIMTRMGFKDEDIREVCFIIKHHDEPLGTDRRAMKLRLQELTPEKLKLLLQFKYADLKAKSPEAESGANLYKRLVDAVNEITALKECYNLSMLAVNRYDLIQRKIVATDAQADSMLERLLDIVIDAPAFNTRLRLLDIAEKAVHANSQSK